MYVVGPEGGETTLFCLQEGEWGGDGSLLKNELMQYDLRAMVSSVVCLIPKSTFDLLRQTSLPFNQCLCAIMNRRMGSFVGMLAATRLFGPDMRVARALMMVTREHDADVEELAVAQHEIGLIAGLGRQRVNQAIGELRRHLVILSGINAPRLLVDRKRLQSYLKSGA